jgi:glyoxalase family protein
VPAEHQIRGLGPIAISVPDIGTTGLVLTEVMAMRHAREYRDGDITVHVYWMWEGGPAAELHVRVEPHLAPAVPGAGGVHHVAFRTPNEDTYNACHERLRAMRVPSSGPVDRFYFKSLYFREPNGILFEIATDGPGFATDEPLEALGERLALPPFLEPRRSEIEAGLRPL